MRPQYYHGPECSCITCTYRHRETSQVGETTKSGRTSLFQEEASNFWSLVWITSTLVVVAVVMLAWVLIGDARR